MAGLAAAAVVLALVLVAAAAATTAPSLVAAIYPTWELRWLLPPECVAQKGM